MVEPGTVAREESAVRAVLLDEDVSETQHQGDIGARHDRQPFRLEELGEVVAQGAHEHELGATRLGPDEVVPEGMPARAARAHHRVLEGDPAEAEEKLGVPLDH